MNFSCFFWFQAGKNLHFYVTVTDGEHTGKSEVNVNIQDPRRPINPSKPITPPYGFGETPGRINLANFFPRIPANSAKIPNYQVLPPNDSPMTKNVYPPVYQGTTKNNFPRVRNNQTTSLKLVPIPVIPEVKNDVSEEKPSETPTPKTAKTTSKPVKVEEEEDNENKLLSLERPLKNHSVFANTVIPILSIIVVFCTVGAVAVLFRKKIYLAKSKDPKGDMVRNNF